MAECLVKMMMMLFDDEIKKFLSLPDFFNVTNCLTGAEDFLKEHGIKLLEYFVDPVVIHHPKGHTIPRFGNTFDL